MQYNDKELKEALKIFGETYIAELSDELRRLDKKASGDLLKSLDTRIIKTAMGTKYTIQILAEGYLKFVDEGRRPGKMPPISAISKWTRLKGIPQSAAFPIAKSIGLRGIKPTNVIENSLNKITRNRNLNNLEDDLTDWVDGVIDQLLIDLSKNKNITIS